MAKNDFILTLSVIKADVGGMVGHAFMHESLLETAQSELEKAVTKELIIDYSVLHVGDDVNLVMTHTRGEDNPDIHQFAWDAFVKMTEVAKELHLYGAGQDLLADAFSGNIKGLGPGAAELTFEERPSEPILIFCADKTSPGAWNLPLTKIFADPFTNPGLVIDPKMAGGFAFSILDLQEDAEITLKCPEEYYEVVLLLGSIDRFGVQKVYRRSDKEVGASASTQRLNYIAGGYVGKDDPVMIVRTQSGFPAVGEVTEAFARPHLVAGWMRGSHYGPLMPVAFRNANPVRFDGPPRVICAGYQLADGKLIGPMDFFDDPAFDKAREEANMLADALRRHGPFEPHRLPLGEMEYTTFPRVFEKLRERFQPAGSPAPRKR